MATAGCNPTRDEDSQSDCHTCLSSGNAGLRLLPIDEGALTGRSTSTEYLALLASRGVIHLVDTVETSRLLQFGLKKAGTLVLHAISRFQKLQREGPVYSVLVP